MTPAARYKQAHRLHFARTYPAAFKDHGCPDPVWPKVGTANGLTQAICNWLNWSGHRATRINVSGRLIDRAELQESGNSIQVKKWLPSATRRGTADISATIYGRAVMIEVKVGRDKPRPDQLAEQARERAAGGVYEFVYNIEEFFTWYDQFLLSLK